MHQLTQKQRSILTFIQEHAKAHRVLPSYRTIMRSFKYTSVSTVASHIKALKAKGFLPLQEESSTSVLIIGHFAENEPLELHAKSNAHIHISIKEARGTLYAFQVKNNALQSMGILNSDLLIVEATSEIYDETALVEIDGKMHLCKIAAAGPHLRLTFFDQTTKTYEREQVSIRAYLVQLIRSF